MSKNTLAIENLAKSYRDSILFPIYNAYEIAKKYLEDEEQVLSEKIKKEKYDLIRFDLVNSGVYLLFSFYSKEEESKVGTLQPFDDIWSQVKKLDGIIVTKLDIFLNTENPTIKFCFDGIINVLYSMPSKTIKLSVQPEGNDFKVNASIDLETEDDLETEEDFETDEDDENEEEDETVLNIRDIIEYLKSCHEFVSSTKKSVTVKSSFFEKIFSES